MAYALAHGSRSRFEQDARATTQKHGPAFQDSSRPRHLTVRLMVNTFEATKVDPRLSHGEALQKSILAMIDGAKSNEDAHPRLWAPFIVIGEPAKPK
jgi:hypothetical protein